MKIAIAHDSFTQMGGAERVVDALHEMFSGAPVFTLVMDPKFKEKYKDWDIRTSALQTVYLALGNLQYCLPLIPYGVDSLDFNGYDLIISSSSGFVKNLRKPKNSVHINYCHTPTRFLWVDKNYVTQEVTWWQRPFVRLILHQMKKWDLFGASRVTKFIANSKEVQKRIADVYQRDSEVIYPFIDTDFWKPSGGDGHLLTVAKPGGEDDHQSKGGMTNVVQADGLQSKSNYFLIAGRLQPYKNLENIIKLFNELGLPLHVVGTGRQEEYLKSIAKPNIAFLGHVSDEVLRNEYSGALAYIYPQKEDFGLMPLEAAACGTPTIALGEGGALETIIAGQTGEFFKDIDELKIIIKSWSKDKYLLNNLVDQAEKFSKSQFKEKILSLINQNAK
jgi:glycosyltransferase involved in cell wall biosynthesis